MVLSYPHDNHVFGELPENLDTVPGAVARLTRDADGIRAVFETRLTPGHAGSCSRS